MMTMTAGCRVGRETTAARCERPDSFQHCHHGPEEQHLELDRLRQHHDKGCCHGQWSWMKEGNNRILYFPPRRGVDFNLKKVSRQDEGTIVTFKKADVC